MANEELEEENELLRQRLAEFLGSDAELGLLLAQGRGITQRMAQVLHILVKRAPAAVSRQSLHTIFHNDRDDGGPEPDVFAVHIHKIRAWLIRVGAPGKIKTVWSVGWIAEPTLVRWVKDLYAEGLKEN